MIHEEYVKAILMNPKFLELVSEKFADGQVPNLNQLAKAIANLEDALIEALEE